MKVLITGATGLIGRSLVKKLINKGFSINFLTTKKNREFKLNGCKGFYWNPSLGKIDLKAFKNISFIIHLAGYPISKPWTKRNKRVMMDSRILSTQILYNSLVELQLKVDVFISASALAYYDDSIIKTYTENDLVSNNNNFIQKLVSDWEATSDLLETQSNNLVKLRIGLVLSNRGGILPKLLLPMKFCMGLVFGNGNQWQSWIHLDDITNIILHSIENKLSGTFNAVSPNPVKQIEIVKYFASKINHPILFFKIPNRIISLLMGERSQLLLDSHKVSCRKILKTGFKFNFPKINDINFIK
ncbi:MAG: TIGR01777 family protein [Flavobacteriaceae bacterium]|mgnify:CR=1 FL=1|nr:TIGR01777 family protein [Flavobacteriaceae bacterium]|tara:strand:+ start:11937 stop:12839 length:903 start_codon:yes stop_codon:yes gene_type:complete